jgi:endonuclease/exonuclease/phosphatase family metal-dependent hydrolase
VTTLRLTTWNVQNLFRPDAKDAESRAVYKQKLAALAQVIAELKPDVLALQEVGGDDALSDLQAAVGVDHYDHRAIGRPDARGIACAVLSRVRFDVKPAHIDDFPPHVLALGLREIDGQPIARMGRGGLHVRVTRAGFSADIIVVHLKSKLLTFPGGLFSTNDEGLRARVAAQALARRAAEAACVRHAVTELRNAARPVAVLGDLNDGLAAATTEILYGPSGSRVDTRGFHKQDAGDAQRLWNLSALIAPERRFSRVHAGQREMLDHILVSEEFLPREAVNDAGVAGRGESGQTLKRRLPLSVDARVEGLRSIGDDPSREAREVLPDHAAVSAVFDPSPSTHAAAAQPGDSAWAREDRRGTF